MKVILYSAPGCPFCVIIKRYLERNNVRFKEVDISKDKNESGEMQKKSGQANVPVVDVDGTIIVGYDLKRLNEALKIK